MSTMPACRSAKQSSQELNNLGKASQEFKKILDPDGDLEHAHISNYFSLYSLWPILKNPQKSVNLFSLMLLTGTHYLYFEKRFSVILPTYNNFHHFNGSNNNIFLLGLIYIKIIILHTM